LHVQFFVGKGGRHLTLMGSFVGLLRLQFKKAVVLLHRGFPISSTAVATSRCWLRYAAPHQAWASCL